MSFLQLQSTLKIYFDVSSIVDSKTEHGTGVGTTEFRDPSLDLNSYFIKKKRTINKKLPLFRFEYSLHGLNINNNDYYAVSLFNGLTRLRFMLITLLLNYSSTILLGRY